MRAALLLALIVMATGSASARNRTAFDTPEQARRHEVHTFYCNVQTEMAAKQIMRGRWVENRRCW